MSSKTVKKVPFNEKHERPRDGGSYRREANGKLVRIPDPKPDVAPAPTPQQLPAPSPDAAPAPARPTT